MLQDDQVGIKQKHEDFFYLVGKSGVHRSFHKPFLRVCKDAENPVGPPFLQYLPVPSLPLRHAGREKEGIIPFQEGI